MRAMVFVVLAALVAVSACEGPTGPTGQMGNPDEAQGLRAAKGKVAVATVVVSPSSLNLQVGTSASLTATAYDAEGQVVPKVSFDWTSGDTMLIRVSKSGVVTALGNGVATVTASTRGKNPIEGSAIARGMRKLCTNGKPTECVLAVAELLNWTPNPWGTGQLTYRIFAKSLGSSIYHDSVNDYHTVIISYWWGDQRTGGRATSGNPPAREWTYSVEVGAGPLTPPDSLRFEGISFWDNQTSTYVSCRLYPHHGGGTPEPLCLLDP